MSIDFIIENLCEAVMRKRFPLARDSVERFGSIDRILINLECSDD